MPQTNGATAAWCRNEYHGSNGSWRLKPCPTHRLAAIQLPYNQIRELQSKTRATVIFSCAPVIAEWPKLLLSRLLINTKKRGCTLASGVSKVLIGLLSHILRFGKHRPPEPTPPDETEVGQEVWGIRVVPTFPGSSLTRRTQGLDPVPAVRKNSFCAVPCSPWSWTRLGIATRSGCPGEVGVSLEWAQCLGTTRHTTLSSSTNLN